MPNSEYSFLLYEGDVAEVPFKMVAPAYWDSGNSLFNVHGWHPTETPHEADLDLNDPFYTQLLDDGRAIGRTVFQGYISNHNNSWFTTLDS